MAAPLGLLPLSHRKRARATAPQEDSGQTLVAGALFLKGEPTLTIVQCNYFGYIHYVLTKNFIMTGHGVL